MSREIKRAMFERTQSMDFDSMMKFFGAPEPAVYEDVEEIPSVAYLNRGEVPLAIWISSSRTRHRRQQVHCCRDVKREQSLNFKTYYFTRRIR